MARRWILAGLAAFAAGPLAAQTGQPSAQEAMQESFGLPAGPTASAARPAPPPAPLAAPASASAPVAAPAPAAAALTPAQLAGAQAPVGGRYRSQGANLDGSPYEGEAEIVMSGGERCRITWRTGRRSTQKGICMRTGYIFVASYQFQQGAIGIVTYQVQPDGVLKGHWTIADTEGRGVEILTPAR